MCTPESRAPWLATQAQQQCWCLSSRFPSSLLWVVLFPGLRLAWPCAAAVDNGGHDCGHPSAVKGPQRGEQLALSRGLWMPALSGRQ